MLSIACNKKRSKLFRQISPFKREGLKHLRNEKIYEPFESFLINNLVVPVPFQQQKKNTLKIQEKNLHNKPERKEYSDVGGCSLRISRIAIKYLNIFALSYEKRRYPNSIRH